MKRLTILSLFLLVFCCASLCSAARRDPLTDAETDLVRDTAAEPDKRIKLFVKFARERLSAMEEVQADRKVIKDRGTRIHDLLEDFTGIVDELDDNLEDYDHRNSDLRKSLKEVVDGEAEFQVRLAALKSGDSAPRGINAGGASSKLAVDPKDFEFALESAVEAVNTSLTGARKLLAEHTVKFAKKNKK